MRSSSKTELVMKIGLKSAQRSHSFRSGMPTTLYSTRSTLAEWIISDLAEVSRLPRIVRLEEALQCWETAISSLTLYKPWKTREKCRFISTNLRTRQCQKETVEQLLRWWSTMLLTTDLSSMKSKERSLTRIIFTTEAAKRSAKLLVLQDCNLWVRISTQATLCSKRLNYKDKLIAICL